VYLIAGQDKFSEQRAGEEDQTEQNGTKRIENQNAH